MALHQRYKCVSKTQLTNLIGRLDRFGQARQLGPAYERAAFGNFITQPTLLEDGVTITNPAVDIRSDLIDLNGVKYGDIINECSQIGGTIDDKYIIVEISNGHVHAYPIVSFLVRNIHIKCAPTGYVAGLVYPVHSWNDAIYENIILNGAPHANKNLVDAMKDEVRAMAQINVDELGNPNGQGVGGNIDITRSTNDLIQNFSNDDSMISTWIKSQNAKDLGDALMEDYISLIRDRTFGLPQSVTPLTTMENKCTIFMATILPILIVKEILRNSPDLTDLTNEKVNTSLRILENIISICQQQTVAEDPTIPAQNDAISGRRVTYVNLELLKQLKQGDQETVRFLNTFCNVIQTTRNGGANVVDISNFSINQLNSNPNIRINLKKADSNNSNWMRTRTDARVPTIFSTVIPDVATGVTKHISNNGQLLNTTRSLRDIYNEVYFTGGITISGVRISTRRPTVPFPINHIKTIKNALSSIRKIKNNELYDFITNTV